MGVTGQSNVDNGSGTLQDPAIVFPGQGVYNSSRCGDYSGIGADPADGYSFWAANEFRGSSTWNTGITQFGVSPNVAPQHNGYADVRARFAAHTPVVPSSPAMPQDDSLAYQKPLALGIFPDGTALQGTDSNDASLGTAIQSTSTASTNLVDLTSSYLPGSQGLGAANAGVLDSVFNSMATGDTSAASMGLIQDAPQGVSAAGLDQTGTGLDATLM
jgi:hypothetical protein